jgi:hypothetical protein
MNSTCRIEGLVAPMSRLKTALVAALLVAIPRPARAGDPRPDDAEHVKKIARELEGLRHERFAADVVVERQSTDAFRAYVQRELDRSLPPAEADAQSKALQAFGLLPRGYDLRKGLLDLYVSQAGAYYDPETKTFYLLMLDMPEDQLDQLILHELAHALQDQRFDLRGALAKAHAAGNDDAEAALQHVVEGEATFLMIDAALERQARALGTTAEKLGPAAELVFRQMRDMDRAALLADAQLQKSRLGPGGGDVARALDALQGVPDFLFWSLHGPYVRGQWTIYKTKAVKGWAGVDALFRAPPTSTEQVLHPEKAYGEPRDEPAAVALPLDEIARALGPGWRLVRSNTLGEAGTRVFLEAVLPTPTARPTLLAGRPETPAERAAAGWGGDRYAVFEEGGGGLALVWKTAWDTEKDAVEFFEAASAWSGREATRAVVSTSPTEVVVIDVPEKRFAAVCAAAAPAAPAAKEGK